MNQTLGMKFVLVEFVISKFVLVEFSQLVRISLSTIVSKNHTKRGLHVSGTAVVCLTNENPFTYALVGKEWHQ